MNTRFGVARLVVAIGLSLGLVMLARAGDAADRGRLGLFGGFILADMGGDMVRFGDDLAEELRDLGGTWRVSKGSRTSAGFGAYYFLPLSARYGFQLEAQYMRRGVDFDLRGVVEGFEINGDLTLALDYLEVPVLLRLSPLRGWASGVVLLAGPVIGFNTRADLDLELQALGETYSDSQDLKDSFKSVQLGAIVAVGVTGEIDQAWSFLLQARYYLGLSNAFDESAFSSKPGDLGFFVGLEFGFSG